MDRPTRSLSPYVFFLITFVIFHKVIHTLWKMETKQVCRENKIPCYNPTLQRPSIRVVAQFSRPWFHIHPHLPGRS